MDMMDVTTMVDMVHQLDMGDMVHSVVIVDIMDNGHAGHSIQDRNDMIDRGICLILGFAHKKTEFGQT